MPHKINLDKFRKISNSGGFTTVPGVHKDNIEADVGLRVTSSESGGFCFTLFGPAIRSAGGLEEGTSKRSAINVFPIVEICRQQWIKYVIERNVLLSSGGQSAFDFPFEKQWNFRKTPQVLEEVVPKLALAGDRLYQLVFETECDEELKRLSSRLRTVLVTSRCVSITSSDLFLPWGMLYTHPVEGEDLKEDGSNWKKAGFWGYQHIIQQTTENYYPEARILLKSGEPALSVNFDSRLSADLKLPAIDEHLKSMCSLGMSQRISRTTKGELQKGFTEGRSALERIIYFYCHGRGSTDGANVNLSKTELEMTDDTVSAYDFQLWSKDQKLPTNPLVFINACQGGQMTTMFYKTLAEELLREGVVGLVGAQIDLPAVFAIEYARRLFKEFFGGRQRRRRLGPLLRKVNRTLLDTYKNPLGLVYSLYRGVDCFIE